MALPGLPDHPALRPRSPVLAAARETLGGPQTSFLLPAPTEPGGYLRGLTHRELEVLGCRDAAKSSHDAR